MRGAIADHAQIQVLLDWFRLWDEDDLPVIAEDSVEDLITRLLRRLRELTKVVLAS